MAIRVEDIHPLTNFLRDHKAHLVRLRETQRPEILTVNGKAQIVVQDARAYQEMLELIDTIESAKIIRERLDKMRDGEPGIPMEEAFAEIRTKLGIKE